MYAIVNMQIYEETHYYESITMGNKSFVFFYFNQMLGAECYNTASSLDVVYHTV